MIVLFSSLLWASDVDMTPEDVEGISAALSLLRPGDTLSFTGGTYDVTGWNFAELVGEEGNPIRIVAAEGSEFIIRANEEGVFPRGIYVYDSTWLEIAR